MNARQALPPDCSAARFAQALRSFAAVLGDDAVLSAASGLVAYLDPYSPLPDGDTDAFAPAAVLLTCGVTQVQAVLRLATAGLPLWPVSIGTRGVPRYPLPAPIDKADAVLYRGTLCGYAAGFPCRAGCRRRSAAPLFPPSLTFPALFLHAT